MKEMFKKMMGAALALVMVFGIAACNPPEKPKTDLEIVKEALGTITMPSETSTNLTLPTLDAETYPDVTLTFKSANAAVITDEGAVTRSYTADVNVNFTVTAKKGEAEDFKNFEIKVLKREATDAEKVAAAKEALTLSGIDALTDNLTLPLTGEAGTTVSWTTSDSTAITAAGVINPNGYKGANKTATLTATITSGTASDTKEFNVTVLAKGFSSVPVTFEINDYTLIDDGGAAILRITGNAHLDANIEDREFFIKIGDAEKIAAIDVDGDEFVFEVDVTDIALKADETSSDWLDIYMYVAETNENEVRVEKRFEITDNSAMPKSDIKLSNNYVYLFRSYETGGVHYLKLQRYLDVTSISRMSDSSIYFELDGNVPYLVVEGTAYINNIAQSRTLELEIYKDNISESLISAVANEYAGADDTGFLFRIDISGLENSGAWYEPVLIITEDDAIPVLTMLQLGDVTNGARYDFLDKTYTMKEGDNLIKFTVENRKPVLDVSFEQRHEGMFLILEGNIATDWLETNRVFTGVEFDFDNNEGSLIAGVENLYEGEDTTHYKFEINLDELETNSWKLFKIVYTEDGTPYKNFKIDSAWYGDGPRGVITQDGYRLEQQYNQLYFASKPDDKNRFLEISFEEAGGNTYLVLNGRVKNDSAGFGKDITGIALGDQSSAVGTPISGVANLYEGSDTARYLFKININDLSEHEWNCFFVVFDDGGTPMYEKEINNSWYEDPTEMSSNGHSVKLHYHQVYYYTMP